MTVAGLVRLRHDNVAIWAGGCTVFGQIGYSSVKPRGSLMDGPVLTPIIRTKTSGCLGADCQGCMDGGDPLPTSSTGRLRLARVADS